MAIFSRLKGKDGKSKKKGAANDVDTAPAQPQWTDGWARVSVEPEEIHELIRYCTEEIKARGLHHPFFLLPFRPTSDPSAVRTFVRHFFDPNQNMHGEGLVQELRMTEPMVLSGVIKWCWSRLMGGVVGWDAYELFKVGELDSNMARDSFKTFIPISVENGARQRIIFDFFDLMAAIAAHGKKNGLGGRKLSRMAAWWAFEHKDTTKGFEGGYNAWMSAANATSHLFFAYLRSLAPEQTRGGVSMLPMSLQKLMQETEYPPQRPDMMMSRTNKVVMIVDTVSPTPFALLRRANHFQYRDEDRALREFSEYEDPVAALTDECTRVLKAIAAANQSQASSSKHSTSLRDASWSRFEDMGFGGSLEDEEEGGLSVVARRQVQQQQPLGLRTAPASGNGLGRPTTPSWADFLSSGFIDDNNPNRSNLLLPPDKVLPPIDTQTRGNSSQSHRPRLNDEDLQPGELASITTFDLDDAFWWVWMSSLAPEETSGRKSAFGRCAVIETRIRAGRWLVLEEMVSGAAPEPVEGAYIAEKKGFFSWTKRGKGLGRRKSIGKSVADRDETNGAGSKTSIGPDTHARIQAKAAQLRAAEHQMKQQPGPIPRRGRTDAELIAEKTNSVFTLQPTIIGEASSAMKWVKKYDKGGIKDVYLSNTNAGRGMAMSPVPSLPASDIGMNGSTAQIDAPEVPAKEPSIASPLNSPVIKQPETPITPSREQPKQSHIHPLERSEPGTPLSPPPPPKDGVPDESAREQMVSPTPTADSMDKPHKKLHKDHKENRGFRKLFGRKNRNSKLPENAATDLSEFLRNEQSTPEPPVQQMPTPAASPAPVAKTPTIASDQFEDALARQSVESIPGNETALKPVAQELKAPGPQQSSPTPPSDDSSTIGAPDAAEAKQEFSRFDQGPLADQPAFVPQDDAEDDEDDATPPPIARHSPHPVQRKEIPKPQAHQPQPQPEPESESGEHLNHSASAGVQDRWAQIRKNAADRAATRQVDIPQPRGYGKAAVDGEEDTNGEETIESRVARIKARVAELTGNMEGTSAPGQPIPARR